uniref:Putative glycoprotein n=1 Tax=Aedes anphevirus TaxID=2230910 RepID=A0A2Z4HFB4_9MONO|nr:putative glycoprotein [Aedes anphevirus]
MQLFSSSKKSSRTFVMISLITLAVLVAIRATVVTCLTAFDCNSKSINLTSISLVTTPSCDVSHKNITYEQINIAVTQSTERYELPFFRCHVESRSVMGRCGRTIDTFHHAGLFSEIIRVDRHECDVMHKKKVFRIVKEGSFSDIQLSPDGQTRYAYVSRGYVSPDGSCTPGADLVKNGREYDRPLINTELTITISTGTSIVSVEESQIRFPNGKSCKLQEESCFDADYGDVFWSVPTPSCDESESEKSLVYEGPGMLVRDVNGNSTVEYIHVHYSGYDFQVLLQSRQELICGYRSFYTEHPRLFVTLLSVNGPKFPLKRRVTAVDVSLLNFVNSKLVYSFRHIKQEVSRLFDLFNQDRCQSHNRVTQNLLSIALLSPQEFAYTYGGPGHTAVSRGEVIYLAQCRPVAVVPDLNVTGCYNELPVVYNNETMFMTPRSRILINVGTPLKCLPDLLPKYYLNENWYVKTDHGLIETKPPQTIAPNTLAYEFRELSVISGGGLYRADIIQKYQAALISPMVEAVISTRVVDSLRGEVQLPSGYHYTSAFSPLDYESIKSKVGGFWDRFTESAVRAGGWFGFVLIVFGIYKFCLYVVTTIINFMHVRHDVGTLWAIPICLFDVLCNLVFHGRIWKGEPPAESVELEEILPNE